MSTSWLAALAAPANPAIESNPPITTKRCIPAFLVTNKGRKRCGRKTPWAEERHPSRLYFSVTCCGNTAKQIASAPASIKKPLTAACFKSINQGLTDARNRMYGRSAAAGFRPGRRNRRGDDDLQAAFHARHGSLAIQRPG